VSDMPKDRRVCHALRDHIDCLIAEGASLTGRDPVQLSFKGRTLTVQHGMLICDDGHQDLIETLAELEWSSKRTRDMAIEICLKQLQQAIGSDDYPDFPDSQPKKS